MTQSSRTLSVEGPAGNIEVLVDEPDQVWGLALVAHPHPLLGGTHRNKVTYILAHALRDCGYVSLRPNFRGVGRSAGQHDEGRGETLDLLALLESAKQRWPAAATNVALAGFSFGAYVQTLVAAKLEEQGKPAGKIVLAALAAGRVAQMRVYEPAPVPKGSLIVHGDQDQVVPLANVQSYAAPLGLDVIVVEGADHFFGGKLPDVRRIVEAACRPAVTSG